MGPWLVPESDDHDNPETEAAVRETAREAILERLATKLAEASWRPTVRRESMAPRVEPGGGAQRPASAAELPLVTVVGALPLVRGRMAGAGPTGATRFVSEMEVSVQCYGAARKDLDATLSAMAADVWRTVMEDRTQGGLALWTKALPRNRSDVMAPYFSCTQGFAVGFMHLEDAAAA